MSLIIDLLEKVKQDAGGSSKQRPISKPLPSAQEIRKSIRALDITDSDLSKYRFRRNDAAAHTAPPLGRFQNLKAVLIAACLGIAMGALLWMLTSVSLHFWDFQRQFNATRAINAKDSILGEAITKDVGEVPRVRRETKSKLGIFFDREDPICLLGGQILHAGDYWEDNKIISINRNEIMLRDPGGKIFYLKP